MLTRTLTGERGELYINNVTKVLREVLKSTTARLVLKPNQLVLIICVDIL